MKINSLLIAAVIISTFSIIFSTYAMQTPASAVSVESMYAEIKDLQQLINKFERTTSLRPTPARIETLKNMRKSIMAKLPLIDQLITLLGNCGATVPAELQSVSPRIQTILAQLQDFDPNNQGSDRFFVTPLQIAIGLSTLLPALLDIQKIAFQSMATLSALPPSESTQKRISILGKIGYSITIIGCSAIAIVYALNLFGYCPGIVPTISLGSFIGGMSGH